ncbi:MAG TPA: hypothetical protein VMI54_18800 [Polyangiaceae bacterium]|nr:hypothetical protein [Polyangiaceae bacterium]
MAELAPSSTFERAFVRRARAVRLRLLARDAALGAAFGAAMGGALAGLFWWLRLGTLRAPVFGGAVLAGALVGLFAARKRRWSNSDVALYLDAKLGTGEVITTAVEGGETPARANVREQATLALAEPKSGRTLPRVLTRWHGLLPLGSAAAVWLSVIPLPPAPAPPALAPGAEHVKKQDLAGLERIEALAELGGANPAQEERLKRLAAEAKKLREDIARGVEKRDALARIAKLRDDIAAEQLRFGDAENRAGLDAAVNELMQKELTQRAARALGDGDLTAFDAEMQRLATLTEKRDRDIAKQALEDAAKAARDKGAKGLAGALERQKAAMERAESKLDALKELAGRLGNGLDREGKEALGELERSGSPEAQKKLAEALDRALKNLSEDERKKLAENLRRELERSGDGGNPMTKKDLEDLARRLDQKGSDRELEEELRDLARRDQSDDARRQQGLGDADRGGAEAQRGLGAMPMPVGGAGSGKDKPSGPQQEQAEASGPGQSGTGTGHDEGTGTHDGKSAPLDVKELRSKADGQLLPGAPMHAATLGRAPARAGETANQLGTGTLGQVGPQEVGAVEGADIPEEYREQVGRYFEP